MWQEIEEEREDTSFVQMKRGRHRYPGLGTRKKLHWGSSCFFRRSGAAAGKFPPGELFPPAPRPSLPPFSRISLTLAFPSRPNPHHPCSNRGSSRRCFSDGTRCRPGRREVERASGRCRRRHHQHHHHNQFQRERRRRRSLRFLRERRRRRRSLRVLLGNRRWHLLLQDGKPYLVGVVRFIPLKQTNAQIPGTLPPMFDFSSTNACIQVNN